LVGERSSRGFENGDALEIVREPGIEFRNRKIYLRRFRCSWLKFQKELRYNGVAARRS
jgi:hypothetical protein